MFIDTIQILVYFFEFVGAALIVYGGFIAAYRVLMLELKRGNYIYNKIRLDLTSKIVFGLEFLIAADILLTIVSPSQEDLIILAVTVIIRTVLGYFLEKEAMEFNIG